MKTKTKSLFFKGLVLVLAFALTAICVPIDEGLRALAETSKEVDYTHITIGKTEDEHEIKTTVTQGGVYHIKKAYIGGEDDFVIGKVDVSQDVEVNGGEAGNVKGKLLVDNGTSGKFDKTGNDVLLVSSKVTVKYNNAEEVFDEVKQEELEEQDVTGKVVVVADQPKGDEYGYFTADSLGAYTITYSYTYQIGDKQYINSYDLRVESKLADASINFEDNDENFLPSIYDLKYAKDGDSYKNLHIPTPTIKDADGNEIEIDKDNIVTSLPTEKKDGDYVVVTAKGGVSNDVVTVEKDETTGNLYIKGDSFNKAGQGATNYTIKYAYYKYSEETSSVAFVCSTTKTTNVYAEANPYYENYSLDVKLSKEFVDDGETCVEKTLPSAVGITGKDTKRNSRDAAGESVDTSYSVRVYYKKDLTGDWAAISKTDYNDVVADEKGTLADPSKFKPLKDGFYTFEYEVVDAYNNHKVIDKGVYVYDGPQGAGIVDEQSPTALVYEATKDEKEIKDESYKLKTRTVANSVIVYAIGIDDNVESKDGVKLVRKIMTDSSTTKLVIDGDDQKLINYNLVFNYRATNEEANDAYSNLLLNNFALQKKTEDQSIDSDGDMLKWLNENQYKIVVDEKNVDNIVSIFKDETNGDGSTKILPETVTAEGAKKEDIIAWFKGEEAFGKGFAFISCKVDGVEEDKWESFGASTNDGGMGYGQYYIHYIVTDAAGNSDSKSDLSRPMYITSFTDSDAPTIKFGTTLSGNYLPTATVTFDVPTANDNGIDTNMRVRTFYRFLDKQDNVINGLEGADADLAEIWKDIENDMEGGAKLTDTYKAYHDIENGGDKYKELTEEENSKYSIKLSEGTGKATKLQIFVYAYDDSGNVGIYAQTVRIMNFDDNTAPIFDAEGSKKQTIQDEYMLDDEISIPEVSAFDDAVEYMSYDIKVYYGADREKVSVYGDHAERQILSTSGAGKFTVKGAKFTAGTAGDYQAVVTVKDSKNNSIVKFINFTVKGRTIYSEPAISDVSLTDQTIELDDYFLDENKGIELPTPTISYQIPNSTTYDKYLAANKETEETWIVKGVDENSTATNVSLTHGYTNFFRPTSVGEFPITYTATVEVFNKDKIEYQELTISGTSVEGGYFKLKNGETSVQITPVDNNTFKVVKSNNVIYARMEGEGIKHYKEDGSDGNGDLSSNFNGLTFKDIFDNLHVYILKSSTYTITVRDTKVYENALKYDYEAVIPNDKIASEDGYDLTIQAIRGQDASGIDMTKSYVELSWDLANGEKSSKRWTGLAKDATYNIKSEAGNRKDGTYTVTYYIWDKAGNSTSKPYEIAVGDNVDPTITIKDGVATTYEIGSKLEFVKADLYEAKDASGIERVELTLENTTTGTKYTVDDYFVGEKFSMELTEAGKYVLTIHAYDAVGNDTTEEFKFDVTARAVDNTFTYKTVGTILIVISVVVLAGVIIYFIVSKVKLDKELKK